MAHLQWRAMIFARINIMKTVICIAQPPALCQLLFGAEMGPYAYERGLKGVYYYIRY
jgi:hypothetical protein